MIKSYASGSICTAALLLFAMLVTAVVCVPLDEAYATQQEPGIFAKGRVRGAVYGGAGSAWGSQSYLILGVGAGYYLVNGLEAGMDVEGWFLNTPQFYKLTPQVRYIFWQVPRFKPYAGAFWRRTLVTDDNPDYSSWGGRLGIAFQRSNGRSFIAVGAVYERFIQNDDITFLETDIWYPEVAFWISF